MSLTRRVLLGAAAALAAARAPAADAAPSWATPSWDDTLRAARGQTVWFNAWAGDDRTNAFIAWAGKQLRDRHGVGVTQVRLRDTSEAVARVVAEKQAGRTTGGSVDAIWINGANFLALKQAGLLAGPVLNLLPNAALIDTSIPSNSVDFTIPVDGDAVPWRLARIVFLHDAARVPEPPRSMAAMLPWAEAHPGRLTHPTARDFLGVTFLKQALYEMAPDRAVLAHPATDSVFGPATAPLWAWYHRLRPALWRRGANFPASGPAQRALMNDGEIDMMISFTPAEAVNDIAAGRLPDTVRTTSLAGGTIGNTSFIAIPFNAAHRAGALVLADFLLSPEAQAHAADPLVLGSPTVLALNLLGLADRARFDAFPHLPGGIDPATLGPTLPEPHPSWMTRLTEAWERRVSA